MSVARVVCLGDIYGKRTIEPIIHAANKPKDKGWSEWLDAAEHQDYWFEDLSKCDDSLTVSALVLLSHGNRTTNLRRIFSETDLSVISSTERHIDIPTGRTVGGEKEVNRLPDTTFIYGRPPLPDFERLTDEEQAGYLEDGITDLDDLIPVYDHAVQTFSYKQVSESPVQPREALVLCNGQPMLWSESITELFAWRGTGKTLLSLGLALHLAAGKSMPGFDIPKARKVLYVEGELPASQLKERIAQLSQGLGDISGFNLTAKSWQGRRRGQAAVTINTEAGRLAIEAELEDTGATVLVLDSVASLARIDTNNEEQWIPLIEWMVDLRCRGICVVYLQQAGKKGEQRGHSVSEDRIDRAIKLTKTAKNPNGGASFKMTFTKEREGSITPLQLTCTKGVWALDEQVKKTKEEPIESGKKEQIIKALRDNESRRDIAKRFEVSSKTISKLKKEMTHNDIHNTNAEV
jgi:hypothetical protein